MEKYLRKLAVNICGVFYALWLIIRNLACRLYRAWKEAGMERATIRTIEKANALSKATGYTYYVLEVNGRVILKPKRLIKNQLACKGKYFKRGTTIQDIERIALYVAKNQKQCTSE